MAKIARRSVASNPSSLTSITIPPQINFIKHNFNHSIRQQKRSTNPKPEINISVSETATTPIPYYSPLSLSSTSLDTSPTFSLSSLSSSSSSLPASSSSSISPASSTSSVAFLTDTETSENDQLSTLSETTITTEKTTSETVILSSVDPLRSTDYQLTTRTIPISFNNSSNDKIHHYGDASANQLSQKSNNSYSIKNINNNDNNISENEISKKIPITTAPSKFTTIPTTTSYSVNKTVTSLPRYHFTTTTKSPSVVAAEREKARIEFYATYDVMTGVRIAATLGGFFSLMVFLIVWKSRSHSNETIKALKDPKTAALTVACMQEEEDRKIIEAMDATGLSIFPDEYDTMLYRRQRMLSIGNVSAPPVLNRGFRFSSVGGYSSLLEPSRRFSISSTGGTAANARRRSTSESSRILSNYPMGSSFGTDDYFIETDDELNEDYENLNQTEERLLQNQGFLEVPSSIHHDTRRSSAMTCCSTESSYLERRCSALTLGINNLPPALRQKDEPIKKTRRGSSTETWDYYYPDIQVIQATPKTSPLASDKDFDKGRAYKQGRTISQDTTTTAGSGVSSITIDSCGSSWQKNSMTCFYDPESLQDRKLPSIDSEHSLDFCQSNTTEGEDNSSDNLESQSKRIPKKLIRQPTIITTTSATPSPQTLTDKFDDEQELKLQKYSDASSCLNNNTSFSYFVSNNNNIFENTGSCITQAITQPPSSTYSVNRFVRSNLRGVGTIGGTGIGRAPLASCSSFKMSSVECQDSDMRSSFGDDESVFIESYADTDDDLEQFSTDSDEISLEIDQTNQNETHIQYIDDNGIMPKLPINKQHLQPSNDNYESNSFYEHQISIKSAPPEVLNGKKFEDNKTVSSKGAILKQNYQRASMESHRALSVSSSDKVLLVPKAKQTITFEHDIGKNNKIKSSDQCVSPQYNNGQTSYIVEQKQQPQQYQRPQHYQQQEELLLKPVLSPGTTPLLAIKRAQFQQQFSDASQSLPTTDETTTLETCSTEVPVVTTIVTTNLTGTSTTTSVFSPATSYCDVKIPINKKYFQQQYIQKPPITIKKQSSFSYDNNNDSSFSSNSNSNNINRNLSKKRYSSSNKNTNKKFKIKNRTSFSESSVPQSQQSQLPSLALRSSQSMKSKILIPQSSKETESEIKTITDKITDNLRFNYTKITPTNFNEIKSITDNINNPERSKQKQIVPFHIGSCSDSSSRNKNIDDYGTILIDSTIQQQIKGSNLLEHSNIFSTYGSTSKYISNTNVDKNVTDDYKKQIIDVSIVIEGVDNEDNSPNNLYQNNNKKTVTSNNKKLILDNSKTITSTSVMLELPVIRIPTENDDDDSSISSKSGDTNEFTNIGSRVRSKSERCDPPIRDPSLPESSRKWSKETLF